MTVDCFRLERLPDGICTHWKAPPLHGAHPERTFDAWMSPLKVLRCSDTQQEHVPMRGRYLIAIIAGIAVLPLAALAQQAVPSIAPQVHEEMWAIPSSPVPMLAYLIRPVGGGGGPFPLVVMNHGVSLDTMQRSYFPAIEFRDAALWFARQGYVVVAPVRPGYGATAIEIPERGLFGLFFSGVGKCSDAEFREAGLAVASIDRWIFDNLQPKFLNRRNEVIFAAKGGGGGGSIALGSQNPESVRAIIGFAA